MAKECWQLKTGQTTPCFRRAGGTPCSAPDCAVIKAMRAETFYLDEPSDWMEKWFPHTRCRLSALSPDNQEFLERTKGKTWEES